MSTANAGCKFGIVGVMSSLACTFMDSSADNVPICVVLVGVGAVVGTAIGGSVSPMKLPQTVAGFHSFVGLAAMCTSIGSFVNRPDDNKGGFDMENTASVLGDFVGAVTFTGSIIAFGKLNGNLKSTPLNLPGKNFLNLAGLFLFIYLSKMFLSTDSPDDVDFRITLLWAIAVLAMVMSW